MSCRNRDGKFYVMTDRWQKYTSQEVNGELLKRLSEFCSEFLIHAVDVEGKQAGIDSDLISILLEAPCPVTYAGGVGSLEDVRRLKEIGQDRIHVTVGSALQIFGGSIPLESLIKLVRGNYAHSNGDR